MDIKTEADSNAMTECLDDDKPITGTFGFLIPYSLHSFLVFELFSSFQWLAGRRVMYLLQWRMAMMLLKRKMMVFPVLS